MNGAVSIRLERRLIAAHGFAALAGLVLSAVFGLLVSVKFHLPEFLTGQPWLTWGRLRYDHTQGILYAWLGNAFLAFLYYAVPYLTRRAVTSVRLGWALFVLWNLAAVLGGWTLVLAGVSQPLEWAEFPLAVAAVVEIALVVLLVQFVRPLLLCGAGEIYVAGWYLLGGITFTALAFPVGNIVPNLVPGAMGAAFSGLWIHDAVGLFVTPFALAIAYFVIPAVTGRPIYSHFYSMAGFWLLFLVYPLNGIHHYLYSSLPMGAQHAAEVASIYQGIDVVLVVANLLLSIPVVVAARALRDLPLRFVWTSVVLYLIVSLQGSAQAVMSINRYVHFTDWVIGHSHLAMIGFASFAAMGALAHIWQRTPGARLNRRALAWSYWLLVSGLAWMVADLTAAGLVQASLWNTHLPWLESVRASMPYWLLRSIGGGLLLAGFVCFGASRFSGPAVAAPESVPAALEVPDPLRRAQYWIDTAYAATFGAGVFFFLLSFFALGILPAIHLRAEIAATTPASARLELTPAERRGRESYSRNGCGYCHTQQVRMLDADIRRFGPPTEAWETARELPQLWGTRRVGPDLARETGRRSEDWQRVHLFNPRYIVPASIMPSYSWMFDGDPEYPSAEAADLVAYLQSLGRPAARLAPTHIETVSVSSPSMNAAPSQEGRNVFLTNCAGCHGVDGDGRSPGGRALRPVAFNLAGYELTGGLVWRTLQHGVRGSSMQAWTELPAGELAAVAGYARRLGGASGDLTADARLAPEETLLAAGRRVFDTHCVRCHGDDGGGNGPDAAKRDPRPANFHEMRPSYPAAEQAIHAGVPGSAMEAWPLLTPGEIQAVTCYIRTMFRGPASPTPAQETAP